VEKKEGYPESMLTLIVDDLGKESAFFAPAEGNYYNCLRGGRRAILEPMAAVESAPSSNLE